MTTINAPTLLLEYAENAFENVQPVGFIIVGDRKSPDDKIIKITKRLEEFGYDSHYLSVKEQDEYLKKSHPKLSKIIPYDSDNRRNVGYIYAKDLGAKRIINIDDDNYVDPESNYFLSHRIVGLTRKLPEMKSSNNWFNPCELLDLEPKLQLYMRGFPLNKRAFSPTLLMTKMREHRIALNMGLWYEDPDIDAFSSIFAPIKSNGMMDDMEEYGNVVLARGTYSPINSQNTCFDVRILPAYYFTIQNMIIDGAPIDRYGDIWQGFFVKKVMDRMNDYVAIGNPMTIHRRNSHDYLKDMKLEYAGLLLTPRLIDFLDNIDLMSDTYSGCYIEIAEEIESANLGDEKGVKEFQKKLSDNMRIWVEEVER